MRFSILALSLGALLRKQTQKACATRAGIADGFSRVGCFQDASPKSVRTSYRDAVDNGMVPGYLNRKMTPDRCFQFCRDKAGARFFLIHAGTDCYCAEYYHDVSTGGGTCDLPCEGDTSEMCGGTVKASVFEMHTCGNSMDLAASAAQSALEQGEKAEIAAQQANETYTKMRSLAASWELPICTNAPQLCQLRSEWEDVAQKVYDAGLRASVASSEAIAAVESLHNASAAPNASASAAGLLGVEQGMAACREAMSNAATKATVVDMALVSAAGALHEVEAVNTSALFETASPHKAKGWVTQCDLVPLEGKSMLAVSAPDPAGCGTVCMDAGDECVGFNYQAKAGLFACQLLSDEGVFEQDDALRDAFGVYEFSTTKVQDMELDAMDCMVKSAFLVRNGGISIQVLDKVFVE